MFSDRVPRRLEVNRVTHAVRRARAAGRPLIDLTISNPTEVGIAYEPATLQLLASPAALRYQPEPFGLLDARRAVALEYARRGLEVDAERIVLTASTSEAYSLVFKLMCAASGDHVMVPAPSYPLFDHLTRLDGVRSIAYRLEYHGRWELDVDQLDRGWTSTVRAVLGVSPNNPTGSVLSESERSALATRCAQRDSALIVDEVFADYRLTGAGGRTPGAGGEPGAAGALTFRLGGLSKSAGLPQLKLGWMAVDGPEPVVREALDRLEVICDAYLSVATPVQVAAASLIESGSRVRERILDRIRGNYRALAAAAGACPAVEVLDAEAGWSAVIRVPSTRSEEDLVIDLIDRDAVIAHPGFFFDFAHEAFLVVSLLPEPQIFAEGVRRLLERVHD
jgi:aspartate/methionine/tyrosine aminotransferase